MPLVRTALVAIALVPAALAAQAKSYVVDPAHSEINFTAESRLLSAHGYFAKWSADIAFDPSNPGTSKVALTIDPASINTRNDRRDSHLKSDAFFDVAKYPAITFTSKKVVKVGENNYNIVGDLTMHGVTKEVTAPARAVFVQNGAARFKGTFTVNRSEYGITFSPPVNPIEDVVEVQFAIAMNEKKG